MPTSVRGWAVKRGAAIGITAQFLALVRILSEVFRIKYFDADRYTLTLLEPFMGAALFTAVLVAVGVVAFAMARYRIALTIAVINVGALLVYKLVAVQARTESPRSWPVLSNIRSTAGRVRLLAVDWEQRFTDGQSAKSQPKARS